MSRYVHASSRGGRHRGAPPTRTHGRRLASASVAAAFLVTLGTVAHTANPETGVTTTGQGLAVELSLSQTGTITLGDALMVDAVASLGGAATPTAINYLSVVDVSGSMENPGFNRFQDIVPPAGIGPEDDCNGDGIQGSAMDAACFGLLSMNASLGNPANVSVGLVAFGRGAVTADVDPGPGTQAFTSPPNVDRNGNGIPDMEEVIRSLDTEYTGTSSAGVREFTDMFTPSFAGGTDFNAALEEMNAAFAAAPEGDNFAAFLSDGNPSPDLLTGAGSPLAEAAAGGTRVHTFALGTIASLSCAEGQSLRVVADATGGVCTEVTDPSTLSAVFAEVLTTRIETLTLTLNGNPLTDMTGSEASAMSLTGIDITDLVVEGTNVVTSTVTAADGTTLTADLEFEVTVPTASIVVTKTARPTTLQAPGGPVDFTVSVANAGAVDVTITALIDDRFGDLDGLGDCAVPFTLAPADDPMSCAYTGEVSGDAGALHVSTVTAEGTSEAGSVTATASATVEILTGPSAAPTPSATPTPTATATPTTSPSPTPTPPRPRPSLPSTGV